MLTYVEFRQHEQIRRSESDRLIVKYPILMICVELAYAWNGRPVGAFPQEVIQFWNFCRFIARNTGRNNRMTLNNSGGGKPKTVTQPKSSGRPEYPKDLTTGRQRWEFWYSRICNQQEREVMDLATRVRTVTKKVLDVGQRDDRSGWAAPGTLDREELRSLGVYLEELRNRIREYVKGQSAAKAAPVSRAPVEEEVSEPEEQPEQVEEKEPAEELVPTPRVPEDVSDLI